MIRVFHKRLALETLVVKYVIDIVPILSLPGVQWCSIFHQCGNNIIRNSVTEATSLRLNNVYLATSTTRNTINLLRDKKCNPNCHPLEMRHSLLKL